MRLRDLLHRQSRPTPRIEAKRVFSGTYTGRFEVVLVGLDGRSRRVAEGTGSSPSFEYHRAQRAIERLADELSELGVDQWCAVHDVPRAALPADPPYVAIFDLPPPGPDTVHHLCCPACRAGLPGSVDECPTCGYDLSRTAVTGTPE